MDNEKITKKENITDNIKISDNVEILKKHFPSCFDKDGRFNLEKFKEEIKIDEINLSKESYGLEWLGKSYARVLTFEPARTLLKEDEEWNKKKENKNSQNLLIKGDNLEVLKHLVNAYYEKIKMIYIDPPYNTGNDGFVYQDDRKFTEQELMELAGVDEERAKRILDFVNSKSNSHSAWLTFMYPRLYIARRLLKEDGVIFVSIDDNEVAQLRILMDEIFGEENFVGNIIRKIKTAKSDSGTGFNTQHEYLLIYSKNINKIFLQGNLKDLEEYKNPDNDPRGPWKPSDPTAIDDGRKTKFVEPIINPYTGKKDVPGPGRRWRFNKETFEKYVKEGRIIFKKEHKPNERGFILKRYRNELKSEHLLVNSLFIDNEYLNSVGTKELSNYFNIKLIDFPKPSTFIKKIIKYSTKNLDIVIDFFAGSGTTGDAVMQLNAEDGGNRKFILVQLPEPIDPKKNKTAYDFVKNELGVETPTIFEICKERLVRAAKKIKEETIAKKIEEKQKEIEKLQNQLDFDGKDEKIKQLQEEIEKLENQDLGFKIFETIPIWEDYLTDDKKLTEQTTLFEVNELTADDLKALLITWKTYDGIPLTENYQEIKLNDYTTYYCGTNLYLLHNGWKTENIKTLLEKIDSDKDFVVEKIIVFGYNFESKHLREIEENIQNYSNKKQIEIETILRF